MKKAIPGTSRVILKFLTAKHLSWLSGFNQSKDFDILVDIARNIVDYEKDQSFAINEGDPNLATKHAFSRGHAAMVTTLVYLFQGAEEELKDRGKKDKGTKKKNGKL